MMLTVTLSAGCWRGVCCWTVWSRWA